MVKKSFYALFNKQKIVNMVQTKKQTKNQEPREICCSKVILAFKFFTIYELQFIFCSKYAHCRNLQIIVSGRHRELTKN